MGAYRGVELDGLELTGPRLLLRPWRPDDAPAVHAAMQDDSMFTYLPLPRPYTMEQATGFVSGPGDEGRADGRGVGCAVVDRASGRLVGSAALRIDKGGEIGYWTVPGEQGRGVATEATRVLRDFAFDVGLPRVWLRCDVRNLASAKVGLRAGMRCEGIARGPLPGPDTAPLDPDHCDLAMFAMIAADPCDEVRPIFAPVQGAMVDGELGLRPVRPDDAQALFETEDEVAAGWSFFPDRAQFDTVRRTANEAGLRWLIGPTARFAMIDLASGAVAGEIGLSNFGPPGVGLIGYGVHPAFRGRGYTTRALRLLTAWAFEHNDYARLELGAKAANVASQRSAANAGFLPDGTQHARLRNPDGTFSDEVRFYLVAPRYSGAPPVGSPADSPRRISP